MKTISVYTIKQVKEKEVAYDLDAAIRSPQDANDIINTVLQLSDEAVEKFGILTLNTKNKVVGIHIVSVGSLNAAIVHPRSVFQAAILNNADSIILFHNHPSGDPAPSPEDVEMTLRLVDAGNIMGIQVLDHIITGDGQYKSLKEEGCM